MKPPNSSNNLSKYEQSFADFACDYSIKARAIASVSLALTFIALNFIFKLSLPIHIFTIAALFQSLINQPYRLGLYSQRRISLLLVSSFLLQLVRSRRTTKIRCLIFISLLQFRFVFDSCLSFFHRCYLCDKEFYCSSYQRLHQAMVLY